MTTRIKTMICGAMLAVPLIGNSQVNISGTIQDDTGETLPGAIVSVEESFLKTRADLEGKYTLNKLRAGEYTIVFSYPGFENDTVRTEVFKKDIIIDITLQPTAQLLVETKVHHVRATETTPTTYTNISRKELDKQNFGQDLPFLLRFTPSTVVTSDAGAGVGYTGMRIRGVDPTRTNVTVNGIPLNDSESHGVFWVNMPDFVSSVENIQVQRGVGTSTNGASAFGASININTNELNRKAYGVIDNAYGSFNTWRNTVKAGTGLINNKFILDARLSRIASDGYIDRASSDLKSYYLSGAWIGKKTKVHANIFSGKEITYQSWYGTPESVINGSQEEITAYADRNYIFGNNRENLLNSGRTYNFYTYENEADNYQQDHYQLHLTHRFNKYLQLNAAGHYTYGRGYYEQYREGDDFSTYGLAPLVIGSDTVTTTDVIRRRWLDNHFFGGLFTLNYNKGAFNATLGGAANQYLGDHFGELIWTEFASDSDIRDRYYDNSSDKTEANGYLKLNYRKQRVTYYLDLQYRHIDYSFLGVDEVNGELKEVGQNVTYDFLNPKAGFMVDINNRNNIYFSMAIANREPVRRDFRESLPTNRPESERLMDIEAGYRYKGNDLMVNANVYYMHYQDQLILTGQINDVGGYTRTNVDESYRAGVELEAGYRIMKGLNIFGNVTLSSNKIASFTEYVDNYDTGVQDTIAHSNTDLAFSPNAIASGGIEYSPIKNLNITFLSKYVGRQFLDNTSSEDRMIDAYFFSNLQLSYTVENVLFKEMVFSLSVNNVFDKLYENNGYTWGYVYGGQRTIENFYYPQAGRNFMARVTLNL